MTRLIQYGVLYVAEVRSSVPSVPHLQRSVGFLQRADVLMLFVPMCQEDQEELSPNPSEEPWPKKFPEPLSWRSDEEDEDSDFGEEQRDRYLKVFAFLPSTERLN